MDEIAKIKNELAEHINPEKAEFLPYFFKTKPGEYGEGDKFLGIVMPDIRRVVKNHIDTSVKDTLELLTSSWHEERMTALLILVAKFAKSTKDEQLEIYGQYLNYTKYINNWDLVDLSCRDIIGKYIFENPENLYKLSELASSKLLWDRRIAIISTFYFLMKGNPAPTLDIVDILINDKQDLIQKANGWMLRELGKRVDSQILVEYLKENYAILPRTTLRYAIERFPDNIRKQYLKGIF